MINYEITRFINPQKIEQTTKHKANSAKQALKQYVYDMLKGQALLDRSIAHKLMNEVDKAEISPPPLGYYRVQTFAIDTTNPLFGSVKIFITRS